jgi:hypothetical protein
MSEYLLSGESFIDLKPSQATSNQLLVCNASVAECAFYRSQYWQVHNLVFSAGIAKHLEQAGESFSFYDVYARGMPNMQGQYDAALINHAAGQVDDLALVLSLCAALLKPSAVLGVQAINTEWYFRILSKLDKEINPWPVSYPVGRTYTKSEISTALQQCGFANPSIHEIYDEQYHDPGIWEKKSIRGFGGVLVNLPAAREARQRMFIKSFLAQAVFTPPQDNSTPFGNTSTPTHLGSSATVALDSAPTVASTGAATSITQAPQHAVQYEQVEALLDAGDLPAAKSVLLQLQHLGNSHRLENLWGIWHFYSGEFLQAFQKFKLAIQGDSKNKDYYQNIAQAAKRCGKQIEMQNIIAQAEREFPGITKELFNG